MIQIIQNGYMMSTFIFDTIWILLGWMTLVLHKPVERGSVFSPVFLKSVCSGAQRFITLFVMLTGTRCYPGAVTGVLIAIALRLYFGACVV